MRKLMVCAALIAGMAGMSALTDSAAFAQKKDKSTKDKSAKADSSAKAGVVEVTEGKDKKFRFVVHNSEKKYLAISAAFKSEKEAVEAVEELKEVLSKTKVTFGKSKTKDKDFK